MKISNVKLVPENITVDINGAPFDTGLRKFGALLGDHTDIGCNAVLNPGSIIGRGSSKMLPCRARMLEPQPEVPPREPPIRFRKTVPACWIALELVEGKNRQVRRMTAAVGHPTLRLIRVRVGRFELGDLGSGQWRELSAPQRKLVLG